MHGLQYTTFQRVDLPPNALSRCISHSTVYSYPCSSTWQGVRNYSIQVLNVTIYKIYTLHVYRFLKTLIFPHQVNSPTRWWQRFLYPFRYHHQVLNAFPSLDLPQHALWTRKDSLSYPLRSLIPSLSPSNPNLTQQPPHQLVPQTPPPPPCPPQAANSAFPP